MSTEENKTHEPFKMVGDWAAQSKALKVKYPSLTDADLKCDTGKEEEMVSRVVSRLSKKREEVLNILRKGQTTSI
jgi:hypothetical protein